MEKIEYSINIAFRSSTYEVGEDFSVDIENPNYNTESLSDILAYGLNYEIGYEYYLDGYISKNKFYVERAFVSNCDEDNLIGLSKEQFNKIANELINNKVIANKITRTKNGDFSNLLFNKIEKEAEEAGRIFGIDLSNAPGSSNDDVSTFTYLALKYVYNKSQFGYGANDELKKSFINGIQKFIDECA